MLTLEWASISHVSQAYISNSPPLPGLAATLGHVCLLVWKSASRDCASPAWYGAWHRQVLSYWFRAGMDRSSCHCALAQALCWWSARRPAGHSKWCHSFSKERFCTLSMWGTRWTQGVHPGHWHNPFLKRVCSQGLVLDMSRRTAGSKKGLGRSRTMLEPMDGASEQACSTRHLSLLFSRRACASSETESEAGDIMDQQFEEMNNRLNSVTDPTGFLRMVRRNNLFNRCVWPCLPGSAASVTFQLRGLWWDGGLQGRARGSGPWGHSSPSRSGEEVWQA